MNKAQKITVKVEKNPEEYDHDNLLFLVGKRRVGFGYIGKDSETIGLIRCPRCERENYAMSVSLGICAWCGWEAKNV